MKASLLNMKAYFLAQAPVEQLQAESAKRLTDVQASKSKTLQAAQQIITWFSTQGIRRIIPVTVQRLSLLCS